MSDQNQVTWFEIMGPKGKELKSFYRSAFGWKINDDNPMEYGVVETADSSDGIGGGVAQSPNGKTTLTVYLTVKDIKAALKKVSDNGGKTVSEPMEIPGFGGLVVAHFADPQGNVVGLMKPPAGQK